MAIKLLSSSPLVSNEADFENDSILGQNEGSITWGNVTQEGNTYYVTIEGVDVEGTTIPPTETTTTVSTDTVNPTKVFWWVARTLKSTLCPECA